MGKTTLSANGSSVVEHCGRQGRTPLREDTMQNTPCDRCGVECYIPTHQYIKLGDKQYYLCEQCWKTFLEWYHGGKQ